MDNLLGVDEQMKKKRLLEYDRQSLKLRTMGKVREDLALWKRAQKEFPHDLSVQLNVIYALESVGYAFEGVDAVKNAEEIISGGERILQESTDAWLRDGAIQVLCHTYCRLQKYEKAQEYANMAGTYYTTREELLKLVFQGEKAVAQCQRNLQNLVDLIYHNVLTMVSQGSFTPEEEIKAKSFALKCFALLYDDGNFGFYICRIMECCTDLASAYLKIGDFENMYTNLNRAVDAAIDADTKPYTGYTAFLVNRHTEPVSATKNYQENESALLLKRMRDNCFAPVRNEKRFQKLIGRLEAISS